MVIFCATPVATNADEAAALHTARNELMTLGQARLYMLSLVNADRAKYHLSPLTMDSIAESVAQKHCQEMAVRDYLAHWDLAGKKPWERYNELGGSHNISENLAVRPTAANTQLFLASDIEALQASFMSEYPPSDGHKKQILRPEHNKLGVGLSYSQNINGRARLYLAQEFIDLYGNYLPLPKMISRGKSFQVKGRLFPGVELFQVAIDWEPKPTPMTRTQLNDTEHCSHGIDLIATLSPKSDPECFQLSKQNGQQVFCVRVDPDKNWKSGLYHIEISAKLPKLSEPIIVSTRTVYLD